IWSPSATPPPTTHAGRAICRTVIRPSEETKTTPPNFDRIARPKTPKPRAQPATGVAYWSAWAIRPVTQSSRCRPQPAAYAVPAKTTWRPRGLLIRPPPLVVPAMTGPAFLTAAANRPPVVASGVGASSVSASSPSSPREDLPFLLQVFF